MFLVFSVHINWDKSAAIFCHQVAAWAPAMFLKFCSVKNYRITNNSTTTEAREKINTGLKSLEFKVKFGIGLTAFKKHSNFRQ
jgi:hypothetical protein